MAKGKNKQRREKKKAKSTAPKAQTEIRRINPVVPTQREVKQREEAQRVDTARVRQAVHGSSYLGEKGYENAGVKILTSRPLEVPKKPTTLSKNKRG